MRFTKALGITGGLATFTSYPCGDSDAGKTLCAQPQAPAPDDDYFVVGNVLHSKVPLADSINTYQYGFVFDADNNEANNYVPHPDFPNDFFSNTDRWYQANYSPQLGWDMSVSRIVDGVPVEVPDSNARIVIMDTVVFFVVPVAEFASNVPRYRVTAFRHTGDYGANPPHNWHGDVEPPVGAPLGYLVP